MKTVAALIATCANEVERTNLGDALHSLVGSRRLQSVVLQSNKSSIWSWDPSHDLANTATSIGIAVICATRKEFDFLFNWLQERVRNISCVTGMTDFPSIAFLPTDLQYLRDRLPQ